MKWFNNLKIAQKLVSSFILVALFIGVVGFVGFYNLKSIDKNLDNVYNFDLIGTNIIADLKMNLLEVRVDTLLALDPKNKSNLQNLETNMATIKTKNDALIVAYKPTIISDLDRQQFADFEKSLGNYRIVRENILKQVYDGNYDKANELYPSLTNLRTAMYEILDKEIKLTTDRAKVDYDNSQSSYYSAVSQMIVITALGLVVAIILGLLIALGLSRQIKKVVVVADALSENDLSKTVDIHNNSEIGSLAKSINKAITNLKTLIVEIAEGAADISATSEELSATTEEISSKMDIVNESVRQVSLGAEQLSATTEEINATTEDIASNVSDVTQIANGPQA